MSTLQCDFAQNLSDDIYIIQVNVTDYAGNTESSRYRFVVDTTPPGISLVFPQNGSEISASVLLN